MIVFFHLIKIYNQIKNKIYKKEKTFHKNGKVISIHNYKNEKYHGEQKYYYYGKLLNILNYKNDIRYGDYKWYYPNGKLNFYCKYYNGQKQGVQMNYEYGKIKL